MEQFGFEKDILFAKILQTLALLLYDTAKYSDALPMLLQANSLFISKYGKQHAEVGETLVIYASALEEQGNLKEASKHYQEALSIQEKVIGKRHPR
jgi:tetratricopeptide (TPR) repeat protein